MKRLVDYETVIFDCDGVVLNSNAVKTRAFYNAALPYGDRAAQQLVSYHLINGGISRYEKFQYFFNNVVPLATGPDIEELLTAYGTNVRQGLLRCEIEPSLIHLRNDTARSRWMLVSGGDQQELIDIFSERELNKLFDGGIFGSPSSKSEIFQREQDRTTISGRAVYLGDSEYDHRSASEAGIDFIFVSQWTEFSDWAPYCQEYDIDVVSSLALLRSDHVERELKNREK